MGKQLELPDLTEEEYEQILEVIRRDYDLRNKEKNRIDSIGNEIEKKKSRVSLLSNNPNFNKSCCINCCSNFLPLISPKICCDLCHANYCKNCLSPENRRPDTGLLLCCNCQQEQDCQLQKNDWFYEKVKKRFDTFGSAEIVRSLHQRKSEICSEPDSGYVSKTARSSLKSRDGTSYSDGEGWANAYSNCKDSLDFIDRKIKVAFERSQKSFGEADNTKNFDDAINAQKSMIHLLLTTLIQEVKESNPEEQNKTEKEIVQDFLAQTYHLQKQQLHPFGINPDGLKSEDYIQRVSSGIVDKTLTDLNEMEKRKVKKEHAKRSNKATLSAIASLISDGSEMEEIQVTDEDDNNNNETGKQSGLTDDLDNSVDLESLKSFTESKKNQVYLPSLDFSSDLEMRIYDTDEADGRRVDGGRPLSFVDTDLDAISMNSSSSFNESGMPGSNPPEESWKLAERGSLMMRKKIPVYGSFRRKRSLSPRGVSQESCETSTTADDEGEKSNLVIFLPETNKENFVVGDIKGKYIVPDHQTSSKRTDEQEDPDILENTNLALFRRKQSLDNEKLLSLSYSDDGGSNSEAPRFVEEPGDVTALLGHSLKMKCTVVGTHPIDVVWYKHTKELLELNSENETVKRSHQGRNHFLEIEPITAGDQGYYMCMASNSVGHCQKGFRISVSKGNDVGANTRLRSQVSSPQNNQQNLSHVERRSVTQSPKRNASEVPFLPVTDNSKPEKVKLRNESSEQRLYEVRPSSDFAFQQKGDNITKTQKRSSLSKRWLLNGSENDLSQEPKIRENLRKDDHVKASYKSNKEQTTEEKPLVDLKDRGTHKETPSLVAHKEENNTRNKSPSSQRLLPAGVTTDDGSKHFSNDKSIKTESFDQIPDPRTIISKGIKKDFVVKKMSNEDKGSTHAMPDAGSNQHRVHQSDRNTAKSTEKEIIYQIRPISKTSLSSNKSASVHDASPVSSKDDVFSVSSHGEEFNDNDLSLSELNLPSVRELSKKFVHEKKRATGETNIERPSSSKHQSNSNQQPQQPHQRQQLPHQDVSNVSLNPVPANRTSSSTSGSSRQSSVSQPSQRLAGSIRVFPEQSHSRVLKVTSTSESTSETSSSKMSSGTPGTVVNSDNSKNVLSLQLKSNPSLYKTNAVPLSSPPDNVSIKDGRLSRRSYGSDYDKEEAAAAAQNQFQLGHFVSKIEIGADYDIVSSFSNLERRQKD